MENTTRTVYGAYIQTAEYLKSPIVILPHSTLNEKLGINQDIPIASTDIPGMGYFAIGNGGHTMLTGADGITIPSPVQHLSTDAALYNQLPYVLRLPNNDLDAATRLKYRLRRSEIHNGVTYIAYYLKVIDLSNTIPQMEYNTVADGATNSVAFAPSVSNLNPTPPAVSSTGVNVTSGDYITVTSKVPFTMDTNDITEFVNVANIIYGNPNYAIISEIGLITGVDKQVVGNFNGVSSAYTDVIGAQVSSFISTFFAMQFSNTGIDILLDVGSVEPLLNISNM